MTYSANFKVHLISYAFLINMIFEKTQQLVIIRVQFGWPGLPGNRENTWNDAFIKESRLNPFLYNLALWAVAPSCINSVVVKQLLCLNTGTIWFSRKLLFQSPVIGRITNPFIVTFSKNMGLSQINLGTTPSRGVGEFSGYCCTACGIDEPHFWQFCGFTAQSKWKWASFVTNTDHQKYDGQYSCTCIPARKHNS